MERIETVGFGSQNHGMSKTARSIMSIKEHFKGCTPTPAQNALLNWAKRQPGFAELNRTADRRSKAKAGFQTATQVVLPILGCLMAAEEYLQGEIWAEGKERKPLWTDVNAIQRGLQPCALVWRRLRFLARRESGLCSWAGRDRQFWRIEPAFPKRT